MRPHECSFRRRATPLVWNVQTVSATRAARLHCRNESMHDTWVPARTWRRHTASDVVWQQGLQWQAICGDTPDWVRLLSRMATNSAPRDGPNIIENAVQATPEPEKEALQFGTYHRIKGSGSGIRRRRQVVANATKATRSVRGATSGVDLCLQLRRGSWPVRRQLQPILSNRACEKLAQRARIHIDHLKRKTSQQDACT